MDLLNYIDSPDDQGGGYDFQNDPAMLAADEKMRREMERRQQTLKMLGIPGEQTPGVRNALQMLASKIQQPAMPPIPMKPQGPSPFDQEESLPQPPQQNPLDMARQQAMQAAQNPAQIPMQPSLPQPQGSFAPSALDRAVQDFDQSRQHDPNNLLDMIGLGSLTNARKTGAVPANTPQLNSISTEYNNALARYSGADPNKVVDADGNIHLTKGQKATQILNSVLQGLVEGPRYRPLRDRLNEEAQREFKSKMEAQQTLNTIRRNQELERSHSANEQLGIIRAQITGQKNLEAQRQAIERMNIDAQSKNNLWAWKDRENLIKVAALDDKVDNTEIRRRLVDAQAEHLDRTGADWKNMADNAAMSDYLAANPNATEEQARRDPNFIKAQIERLGQFAQAASKRDPSQSVRQTIIQGPIDPITGAQDMYLAKFDRQGGHSIEPLPEFSKMVRLSPAAQKEADGLRLSADSASRAMSALAQIVTSGEADRVTGPINGNYFLKLYRAAGGKQSLQETAVNQATLLEILAAVKQNNGANSSDKEFDRLSAIFAKPWQDWRTQIRAVAMLNAYAQMSLIRKARALDTTANPDAVYEAVEGAAESYVKKLEKAYEKNRTLKSGGETVLFPSPSMPTGDDIINYLNDQYGFENRRLGTKRRKKAEQE